MTTQTKNSLLLMLCSFIWGFAFVAQSSGSGMGAYSFLAGRSWLAVLVLIPTVLVFDAIRRKSGTDAKPKTAAEKKKLLAAGFVCGTPPRPRPVSSLPCMWCWCRCSGWHWGGGTARSSG